MKNLSMMQFTLTVILGSMALVAEATPFGAPKEACTTLMPQHGVDPQLSQTPYELRYSRHHGNDFHVTLKLKEGSTVPFFKGFIIQARLANTFEPFGQFEFYDQATTAKHLDCSNTYPSGTVTHVNSDPKEMIEVDWEAPDGFSWDQDVYIEATVVQEKTIFWNGHIAIISNSSEGLKGMSTLSLCLALTLTLFNTVK